MKRTIKALHLKDGKQLMYPNDEECKKLWNEVVRVDIEESYSIEEWKERFVLIRSFNNDKEKANNLLYQAWQDKTKLW